MIFKYLLVLLLVLPVWVEKRTANYKAKPTTYGPINKIGALFSENGRSVTTLAFLRQGSWINTRSEAGLDTNFVWEDSGRIEIMNTQNVPNLHLTIKLNVFSGSISLSSIDGLVFQSGDGIEDQSMEFYGSLENVNNAMANLQYFPITSDPTNKNITGCLSINVDYYMNQAPLLDLSRVTLTK